MTASAYRNCPKGCRAGRASMTRRSRYCFTCLTLGGVWGTIRMWTGLPQPRCLHCAGVSRLAGAAFLTAEGSTCGVVPWRRRCCHHCVMKGSGVAWDVDTWCRNENKNRGHPLAFGGGVRMTDN
jgi:hypothetical protein